MQSSLATRTVVLRNFDLRVSNARRERLADLRCRQPDATFEAD
jgi:hypothetical protein